MTKIRYFFFATFSLLMQYSIAQQIDVDSLLLVALEQSKLPEQHEAAKKTALRGIAESPDYLDFHLLLGSLYRKSGHIDSARLFLHHVISQNVNYKSGFSELLSLELQQRRISNGLEISKLAMTCYPEEAEFVVYHQSFLQMNGDERKEFQFLEDAFARLGDIPALKSRHDDLILRFNNTRLGINYSLTFFDRENVGPWHLASWQLVNDKKWGSVIGRFNYAERLSSGNMIDNGFQFELESYFFTSKKSYSYAGGAYSPSLVFPEYRLGYSFFQNLNRGWEWEAGVRYMSVNPPEGRRDFRSLILGGSKYLGAWWINLRGFVQNENDQVFPAFVLNTRYYLDSRFDYFTIISGYGTSPDERQTLGQFESRIALDSWRAGIGYNRVFWKNLLWGVQVNYNYQEYAPELLQQELEFFMSLQYRFKSGNR